jgi:hypothetical protein
MREITLPPPDGNTYQIGKLSAMEQWTIAKRFLSYVQKEREAWEQKEVSEGRTPDIANYRGSSLESVLSNLSDEDSQAVINTALRAVKRQEAQGGWSDVMTKGTNRIQYADMKMEALIALTFAVMRDNIDSFFTTEQPK